MGRGGSQGSVVAGLYRKFTSDRPERGQVCGRHRVSIETDIVEDPEWSGEGRVISVNW